MEWHALDVRLRRANPLLLMPAATLDEGARLCRLCRVAHLRDDVVPGLRFRQIEDQLRLAETSVMSVAVDEAGNRQASAEIDDASLRADPLLDIRVGAYGGD